MEEGRDSAAMNQPCHCGEDSRRHADILDNPDISVVIPVYRSEATLELLFQRLIPSLDALGRSYEVVLVEDGSPDDSWSTLESLQRRHPDRVVAIQLMRNSGQHNALMCGFRHARGEFVITMDDDLQNPPEEIPRLLEEIEKSDCDLVYGNYADKKHNSFRNLGSLVVNRFYRTVFRTQVTVTSFRVIRRPLLDAIHRCNQSFIFLDGLLAWNTQRVGSVLVAHHPRPLGQSTYSIGKLVTLSINLFTSFSLIPLQAISFLGIAILLLGLGLTVTCLGLLIIGKVVSGSLGVSTVVLILGGVQLLALGIFGEYLGRMHLHLNGKPQYHERQILDRLTNNEQKASCHE
jgi:glycosyltransferase involved in cell wall biosynthesis